MIKITFWLPKKTNLSSISCHLRVRLKSTQNFSSGSSYGNSDACSILGIIRRSLAPFKKVIIRRLWIIHNLTSLKDDSRASWWSSHTTNMTMKCLANLWNSSWIRWRSAYSKRIKWSQTKWKRAWKSFLSNKADMMLAMKSTRKSSIDANLDRAL